MSIKVITGNLLDASETFLCHQCNCVTNRAAHLAYSVFKRFPYSNIYVGRQKPDEPGTIFIDGDGRELRYVISMLAQYYPGQSNPRNISLDGYDSRLRYFRDCLRLMEDLKGSFAFPFFIGCGAAGGDWNRYLPLIEKFAVNRDVTLYRLEN
jgi:hypothetical protein